MTVSLHYAVPQTFLPSIGSSSLWAPRKEMLESVAYAVMLYHPAVVVTFVPS